MVNLNINTNTCIDIPMYKTVHDTGFFSSKNSI